ncbi:MAG: hypothetical protein U1E61_23705 [Bradyrhizobium sp.]
MFRTSILLATAATLMIAASSGAFATPRKSQGLTISDTNGNVVYDDGIPDGRGCVVGTRAIWSPALGKFIKIPASKCNF